MSVKVTHTAAEWKLRPTAHSEEIAQVLNGVLEHCVNTMNCTQIETEQVIIKAMTGYSDCVTGESYKEAKDAIEFIFRFQLKNDPNGGSVPST